MMEAYQKRVITEREKLNIKIDLLRAFISTNAFAIMDREKAELLNTQYMIMEAYSNILWLRIDKFEGKPSA